MKHRYSLSSQQESAGNHYEGIMWENLIIGAICTALLGPHMRNPLDSSARGFDGKTSLSEFRAYCYALSPVDDLTAG
eukprot:1388427-Pyramimonas_sp.AAC.1